MKVNFACKTVGSFDYEFTRDVLTQVIELFRKFGGKEASLAAISLVEQAHVASERYPRHPT